jgi:hypothetical protein
MLHSQFWCLQCCRTFSLAVNLFAYHDLKCGLHKIECVTNFIIESFNPQPYLILSYLYNFEVTISKSGREKCTSWHHRSIRDEHSSSSWSETKLYCRRRRTCEIYLVHTRFTRHIQVGIHLGTTHTPVWVGYILKSDWHT